MISRIEQDRLDVGKYLPEDTRHVVMNGMDVYVFKKTTGVNMIFEIAICYSSGEGGYCASLVMPKIEDIKSNSHTMFLSEDGVLCIGPYGSRVCETLKESFLKSCMWAEGVAFMLKAKQNCDPDWDKFPFPMRGGV